MIFRFVLLLAVLWYRCCDAWTQELTDEEIILRDEMLDEGRKLEEQLLATLGKPFQQGT
jgi:hypothetical protein